MIRIKRYLMCLVCGLLLIPIFGYAINGLNATTSNGYAPAVIGNKTLYVKFIPPGNKSIAGFQLTFYKKAEFLERIVYRFAGMNVKEATERLKTAEVFEHGQYTYNKLSCNRAKLTVTLGKKQFAHPAGSVLIMRLKFNSETSGDFTAHFTENGSHELKGTFELK